jgi:hypothetical protein
MLSNNLSGFERNPLVIKPRLADSLEEGSMDASARYSNQHFNGNNGSEVITCRQHVVGACWLEMLGLSQGGRLPYHCFCFVH